MKPCFKGNFSSVPFVGRSSSDSNCHTTDKKLKVTCLKLKIKIKNYLFESTSFIISPLTFSQFAPSPYHFTWTLFHRKIIHQMIQLTSYSDTLRGKWYINGVCTRWISLRFSPPDVKKIRFITVLLKLPFSACFFKYIFEHVIVS